MVPTYNGWEDTPEDEREALELWEMKDRTGRRSSRAMAQPDLAITRDDWGAPQTS